ncbi:MAG: hypothetical protein J7L15_00385 [Clostridiales bacterium]|nr:hypothetical protein [Clostridiales bacterium]
MKKIDLFIIDPQFDFCDPNGSLFVQGADEDMKRVSQVINDIGDIFNQIYVSMDTHNLIDVSHPAFWMDNKGAYPEPFTIITSKDIIDGTWSPYISKIEKKMIAYVIELEKYKHDLTIWPPHCRIGKPGSNVVEPLSSVLDQWTLDREKNVEYILKGSNIFSEHYSALEAKVPIEGDNSTNLNQPIISSLMKADVVLFTGEAGNKCTLETVLSVINNVSSEEDIKKLWWVEDAISPIPGFEQVQKDFVEDMKKKGMNTTTTEDIYTFNKYLTM